MAILKDGLATDVYDKVRKCLGLEPLAVAAEKGRKVTNKIRDNIEK
jgi:hypothetical protein